VALLLGAFIGLERERDGKRALGIRTFCLIALMGALSAMMADTARLSWLMPLAFLALAILLAVNRFVRARDEPHAGMTTEIAALMTFALGALAYYGPMELAVALGVVVAALLHFKPQLHHLAERVGDKDLYAMLQVAIVAFVVLPVLPNRTFGPLDVLNPHDIWLMVVFISGISLVAYLALKIVGARYGSLASGALGGFVSSTAVTVSFSQQARSMPRFAAPAMLAIMAATLITVPRIAIEIAVVNRELLTLMVRPLGVIALACLIPLAVAWWRSRSAVSDETPQVKNPANLGFAISFGLVYALVTLAIAAAQGWLGDAGLFVVGAVSGITDVDAITLSGARLIGEGRIAAAQGIDMILLAFLTNQVAKATIGIIVAPRSMRKDLLGAFGCVVAGTLAAILLF
jgi:uncharacterized membrane protein (DUF4010 family)